MATQAKSKSPAKPAPAKVLPDLSQGSTTTEQPKADKPKAAKRDRSKLYAEGNFNREDVITRVAGGKPKVKGSMAEAKFALYGNGESITVGEVLDKCKGDKRATFTNEEGKVVQLKPSIRWDWAHNLIRINGKAYEAPAKAAS